MWDWCGGRRLQCHLFNEFAGIFDAKTREASAPAGGTKSHIDRAESPTRARLPYSDGGDCFLGSNKLQALWPKSSAPSIPDPGALNINAPQSPVFKCALV